MRLQLFASRFFYFGQTSILFFVVLFLSVSTHAQIRLEGKLSTSNNQPIVGASILAVPKNQANKMVFATSNISGYYALDLVKNQVYQIKFSHISYESFEVEISLNDNKTLYDVTLVEAVNNLEEIVLTGRLPITVKKDTTTFRVNAFSNGKERKLRELLKKLPGLTVDKDGGVEIHGKKITKLLVDGKQFFDGGTKLGVNNIPANVADEVEIIEDYHETEFFKGLENSQEIAMNIKLKEDKKSFIFGDVVAGAGIENRYNLHPTVFKYSSKLTLNFIGDLNNTIDKSFTLSDYLNFSGGTDVDDLNKSLNSTIFKVLREDDYITNEHTFIGFNTQYNPNEKSEFRALFISLSDHSDFLTKNKFEYFDADANDLRTEDKYRRNNIFLGKLSYKYTPDSKTVLKSELVLETGKLEQDKKITSTFLNDNAPFNHTDNGDLVTGKFFTEFSKKFNSNHITKIEFDMTINSNDDRSGTRSLENVYSDFVPVSDQSFYQIQQDQEKNNLEIDLNANHYWIVNRKNHVYLEVKNTYSNLDFSSNAFQLLESGRTNNFSGFSNSFNFKQNIFKTSLTYKRIVGNAIIDVALALQNDELQIDGNEISRGDYKH